MIQQFKTDVMNALLYQEPPGKDKSIIQLIRLPDREAGGLDA
jgi:hypothetical protein